MDHRTFHAALSATARVACAVAVFGMASEALADEQEREGRDLTPDERLSFGNVHQDAAIAVPLNLMSYEQGLAEGTDLQRGQIQTEALTPGSLACTILNNLGYFPTGCTPWGPPVPPQMMSIGRAAEVA